MSNEIQEIKLVKPSAPEEPSAPPQGPTTWQNIKLFLKQFLTEFYTRILLLVVFILAMVMRNGLGLVYALITVVMLVIEQFDKWKYVYVSYIPISFASIGAQIFFLVKKDINSDTTDISSWLGMSLTLNGTATLMFVLNAVILFLSVIGLMAGIWPNPVMSNEEYSQVRQKFRPILKPAKAPEEEEEESSDSSQGEISPQSTESIHQLKEEFPSIKARYYYKKFDEGIRILYHRHGYELSLFFLLILAFIRLNVISILYVLIAVYFSFFTKYFYNKRYTTHLKVIKWQWRVIYVLLALDIIRQYFFLVWFPLSWNISPLLADENFWCDPAAAAVTSEYPPFNDKNDFDKCKTNWREWISLGNFSSLELIANFISLYLFVNYDKYFSLVDSFDAEQHAPGDDEDFTHPKKRSLTKDIKFFYYCYFFFIPLFLFILTGIKDNVTGQTDVVSCLYLFLGIYLVYDYKTLLKKRNRLWGWIETINNLALLLIVAFQVPIIPCPLALEGRYYYSVEECVTLQETFNTRNQNTLNYINNSVFSYIIIDIIGINKVAQLSFLYSYKEIFMILFYLFAFVQRKIWNHGYMKAYVIPYFERRDVYKYEIGAMYVEQVHVLRKTSHKELLTEQEIARSHERKIEAKIRTWEVMFDTKVEEENKKLKEVKESEIETSRKDKAASIIEEIISLIPEAKVIDFDRFVEILERNNFEEEKVLPELETEIHHSKNELIRQVRSVKKINLPQNLRGRLMSKSASNYFEDQPEGEKGESGEEGKDQEEQGFKRPKEESPAKYSTGGYLAKEKTLRKKYDDSEEVSFKTKVKRVLIRLSQGTSLMNDERISSTEKDSFLLLFAQLIAMNLDKVTFLIFMINHIVNVSVVSVVFPLSLLVYGLLEYPVSPRGFWKFMTFYTIFIITLKVLYQLPFFCGTPPYSIENIFDVDTYDCSIYYSDPWLLPLRIDHIIGIRKFSGDTSYPLNEGLFSGIILDLLSLFCILGIRAMLDSRGIWDYLRIYRSFKVVPQLEDMPDEKVLRYKSLEESPLKKQDYEDLRHDGGEEPRNKKNKEADKFNFKKFFRNMFSFNPFADGPAVIRKPGYDYYKYLVPLSLVILLYFVVFYSSMVGSSKSITQSVSKSEFSGGVAVVVTLIILVMILERVLYISRETYFQAEAMLQNPDGSDDNDEFGEDVQDLILSKNFFYKILLHYVLVIGVNIFFFIVMINSIAQQDINNYGIILVGYLLCGIYLFISSQQIKYGYPLDLRSKYFSKYTDPDKTMYTIYKVIPFLYELTCILDWTATKTSLDLFSWMKYEDASSTLYNVKCSMLGRKGHKRGQAQTKKDKFFTGFCFLFFLVLLLVLPLILFSGLNPSQTYNNVISGQISVSFYAHGPDINDIYTIYEVQNLKIKPITEDQYDQLKEGNEELAEYESAQLQRIEVPVFSEQQWLISPPNLNLFTQQLSDANIEFYCSVQWSFDRSGPADAATTSGVNSRFLTPQNKQEILAMIRSTGQPTTTSILNLFPKFLGLSRLSTTELLGTGEYLKLGAPFNTDARLTYVNDPNGKYWNIERTDDFDNEANTNPVFQEDNNIHIVLASDKIMGSFLSSIGSMGVIGFYVTIVLAVGRLVRALFDKVSQRVIYEEMPRPDDLIELCDAISLARKEEDLEREERLYRTLVRVLRSPEMLLELTGAGVKDEDDGKKDEKEGKKD